MSTTIALGVNIDHVATLRQQRHTRYPEPVQAALLAEQAGAENITLHLREDRRHIQERDVQLLRELLIDTHESRDGGHHGDDRASPAPQRPADCCLVPERRAELTTEGGLDVAAGGADAARALRASWRLRASAWRCSSIRSRGRSRRHASRRAPVVELHTGAYADSCRCRAGA